MSNLIRTTITIPEDVYNQARIIAASSDHSLSSFISRLVKEKITGVKKKDIKNNLFSSVGIFKLGVKKIYKKRDDLYKDRLAGQMGF